MGWNERGDSEVEAIESGLHHQVEHVHFSWARLGLRLHQSNELHSVALVEIISKMTNSHLDNVIIQDWGNITHVASGEHKVEDFALAFVSVCRSTPFCDVMLIQGLRNIQCAKEIMD